MRPFFVCLLTVGPCGWDYSGEMEEKYLGDRVMRLWMRSVWNRLRTTEPVPELTAPVPTEPLNLTLTAHREGRPEALVLLSSRIDLRQFTFRTPDLLAAGETLFLRLAIPGLRLQLSARVLGCQQGVWAAELECSPEQLNDMGRLLSRLAA